MRPRLKQHPKKPPPALRTYGTGAPGRVGAYLRDAPVTEAAPEKARPGAAHKGEGVLVMVETIRLSRGNLPHWLVADRPYFVTIRLHGTLPQAVVRQMAAERDALERSGSRNPEDWTHMCRQQFLRLERILDRPDPERAWLTDNGVATMVLESLEWLQAKAGWTIYAAVLMSTHLHAVMRSANGRNGELLSDLERFKRFTGRKANAILGRSGPFWAREDFDHWCRTPERMEAAVHYVKHNPVTAGLVGRPEEWPWIVGL